MKFQTLVIQRITNENKKEEKIISLPNCNLIIYLLLCNTQRSKTIQSNMKSIINSERCVIYLSPKLEKYNKMPEIIAATRRKRGMLAICE